MASSNASDKEQAATSESRDLSRTEAYYFGVWLLFFIFTLPFIGAVLWAFISAAREKQKAERENDVSYRTLDTGQILGKIAKR